MASRVLILASGSPQRRNLMEQAGLQFDVVVPRDSAEGGICSQCGPAELVADLAACKAEDVFKQLEEAQFQTAAIRREAVGPQPDEGPDSPEPGDVHGHTIIACDTVAECNGEILGKPHDEQHARSMLERLSGTRHRVYSGLCVWRLGLSPRPRSDEIRVAISELQMDPLRPADMEEYLASGLWQGKAGAFGYQDRVGWLHLVEGSESNVIGLPMELLKQMLEERDS